jgi:hypothetical protein
MTLLSQQEPGPAALKAGVDSLLAGERARRGGRWELLSPPHRLKNPLVVAVAGGDVDHANVVAPDDKDAIGNGCVPGLAANEDVANRANEEVA